MSAEPTSFLNVDLDLESSENLASVAQALAPDAYSLERPSGMASFELEGVTDPDMAILRFAELVERFSAEVRAAWDRCTRRTFDVGIQAGSEPHASSFRISANALRAAAQIGAEIAITVYAASAD